MTLTGALNHFFIGLIAAAIIGLLIRSYQEKLHPALWYLVVITFFLNLLFDLIMPLIVGIRFVFKEHIRKKSFRKRLMWYVITVPIAYYLLVANYDTFNDERFWKPFRKVNWKMKQNKSNLYEVKKIKIARNEMKKHSLNTLSIMEQKLIESTIH